MEQIQRALNRIGLITLLDKNLIWAQNLSDDLMYYEAIDTLTKTINVEVNGNVLTFVIQLNRANTENKIDTYHVEVRVSTDSYLCGNSTFDIVLPHKDELLKDTLKDEFICEFISLYEGLQGAYMSQNHRFDDDIIKYANELFQKLIHDEKDSRMTLNDALNRICLSILLDQKLKWQKKGNFDMLSKTIEAKIASGIIYFECSLSKLNKDKYDDEYILDVNVKDRTGKVLICYESRNTYPHNDKYLNEVYDENSLRDFITLYKSPEEELYPIAGDTFNERIISYASKKFGTEAFDVAPYQLKEKN